MANMSVKLLVECLRHGDLSQNDIVIVRVLIIECGIAQNYSAFQVANGTY